MTNFPLFLARTGGSVKSIGTAVCAVPVVLFVFAAIVLFFPASLIVLLIFTRISSAFESGVSHALKRAKSETVR
jgi:hypothetical protein